MSMLMLLPNCHTHVDIMSITEGVVVSVTVRRNPLVVKATHDTKIKNYN